jgi:hypothetical protein
MPLLKELLEGITWFNLEIIKLVVQGVLISITEKMVVEMFKLSKTCIGKLLAKPTKEKEKKKETDWKFLLTRKARRFPFRRECI